VLIGGFTGAHGRSPRLTAAASHDNCGAGDNDAYEDNHEGLHSETTISLLSSAAADGLSDHAVR
jgi:hypothetical protein